jgi:hypothetical protein
LGRRSLATNPLPARSTNAPTTLHCTLHLVVPGRPPSPPAHVPWFHAAQLPLARLLRRPERVNATRAIVAEANDTMPSTAEQLMKLAEMKEKGLLDTKEFIDQKAIVMAGDVAATGVAVAMPSNEEREARERQEKTEREERRERQERQDRQDRQVKSRTKPDTILTFLQ